jgi:hypothetical protein
LYILIFTCLVRREDKVSELNGSKYYSSLICFYFLFVSNFDLLLCFPDI